MNEPVDDRRSLSSEVPWYRRWFGEDYLELYPHRDRAEARAAVDLFRELTRMESGARVLDLACGAGRHLEFLCDCDLWSVGLDLSSSLLRRACQAVPSAVLVRADMRRLPFAPGSFQGVTSFFTSFGYFESEDGDRRVLEEARRVLRNDGWLLLDFLNAHEVLDGLSPRDEEEVDGRRVVQERRLVDDGRVVEKTIRIESVAGDEPPRRFQERVRLYTAAELEFLLSSVGFRLRRRVGDYGGGPVHEGSPRVIVLAQAR
jgi:SAM-dependent methyltransferase